MRLFKEDPNWTPIVRSEEADIHPIRKAYVETLSKRAVVEDESEEEDEGSKKQKLDHVQEKLANIQENAPAALSAEE